MFNAGVPNKMIKDITGHLSDESLRMYECPSDTQQQAVANVLASSVETCFQAQMNQLSTTNITPNNTSCPVISSTIAMSISHTIKEMSVALFRGIDMNLKVGGLG